MGYLPEMKNKNNYLDEWAYAWKWVSNIKLTVTITCIEIIEINWFVKEIVDSDTI